MELCNGDENGERRNVQRCLSFMSMKAVFVIIVAVVKVLVSTT